MDFVIEALGEQRTYGSVNQATGESFEFAGLGFALEEASGDFARSVSFLYVVDSQGKEVLTCFGTFGGHNRCEYNGVVDIDNDCAAGLTRDFTGFHSDRVLAPLKSFANFIE
jgi:hypothetical protein